MSRHIDRRTFLVAGGLTTAAAAVTLNAGPADAAAPAPAKARPFTPKPDFLFRDDTVDAARRLEDILKRLTLDEKIQIATRGSSSAVPRLGLNAGRGTAGEALHGIQDGKNATVFPNSLGLSQTWDEDLFRTVGDVIAKESLADNGGIGRLAPVMDLLHDPRAGRDYETMGEDAFLNGTLGAAMAGGMNARTKDGYQQFLPILKHFLGYNNEINRLWTNSVLPPRAAREYYVKTFWYPISAGVAKSVMTSYPLINGKPMSVNPFLAEMLQQWTPNYPGTGHDEFRTINDYGSGSSMWVHSQRYFPDDPEGRAFGSAQGTKNGQMSWSFRSYGDAVSQIYDAIARGMLTEQDIEDNARRNLALSLRIGDFDQLRIRNPYLAETAVARDGLLPKHRSTALQAGQEQIVLLKNDHVLPLPGRGVTSAVLLGSLGEDVLKDHYTGKWAYAISVRDALSNKLGARNVHYSRAVDTVAIKASNGKYLKAANNPFREPGSADPTDTPILASGAAATDGKVKLTETDLLFEHYDYGGPDTLLRTPINDRYLQVPHVLTSPAYKGTFINNTSGPGEGSLVGGVTQYVNYQKFRVVPTNDGKFGIYNPVAGDGGNNSYGESAMAYDQDDEDVNNGSYLQVQASGQLVADTTKGHVGPYRNENHAAGPDITQAPFDHNGADAVVDALPADYKFDIQSVQTSIQAIDAALAGAPANAPVFLVVGYEPHLNAREAVDLDEVHLGAQHLRNLNYLTKTRKRDVILIVKTGSPMTIDESVHNNPRVRAILTMGHSSQEEGSALVSTLFDDGYRVPATGWAPTTSKYAPYPTYSAYPGYLGSGNSIAAHAPAGRLTATWYKNVADMSGASEDHPPESYRFPVFDERSNDNLSNLDGTVPTGLLTYDIIKGQRTYQYFGGTPLYPFGYGLTYTTFAYSHLSVSQVVGGRFLVSGRVTNTGRVSSDEVVQVYGRFTGAPSRIVQPRNRLVAFQRIKDIAPRESRSFRFEVDLTEKLAVWDVETGKYIVEPGHYEIRAAASSAAPGATGVLQVTTANGGRRAAQRLLNKQVLAENFDDYSNLGKRIDDIELVSASTDYKSNTAVSFRQNGGWLAFKNVDLPSDTQRLIARVGSDRQATLKVYALPAGSDPGQLATATPIASIGLSDSRPVSGLPTGLGIGPIAVTGQPYGNLPYPGSPIGQNGLDSHGQPYKNAYIKPDWQVRTARVTLPRRQARAYDVYVLTDHRGVRLEWFKLAPGVDSTQRVSIAQPELLTSIRVRGGVLPLRANLTPATSSSAVTWSVSDTRGFSTRLATVDPASGEVRATGAGNGTVRVTAASNGRRATKDILITNQLDANKVSIGGTPKTVDYVLLRTGGGFGGTDNIQRYKGTNQQTAVFGGLFGENPNGYYLAGSYQPIPSTEFTWTVTDTNGKQTKLATIDQAGLVTATGAGDGKVLVTATLKNNKDIVGKRVITIQNQAVKNAYEMIQAENYDATTDSSVNAGNTWGLGGNEFGLQVPASAGSTWTFRRVNFGTGKPTAVAVRLAPNASATTTFSLEVWVDGPSTAEGGTLLGTVDGATAASNVSYATFLAAVTGNVRGVHDVYLKPSAAVRLNWFSFGK